MKFFDKFSRKRSRSPPRRDARSVNNARGSLPQRGYTRPSWKFGAEGPTEWGSHVPPRAIGGRQTFSSWAPSWLQVRIFSQFVCIFFARCLEVAFFIVSPWFLHGFWSTKKLIEKAMSNTQWFFDTIFNDFNQFSVSFFMNKSC